MPHATDAQLSRLFTRDIVVSDLTLVISSIAYIRPIKYTELLMRLV